MIHGPRRYYDSDNRRLVYLSDHASSSYWDAHWNKHRDAIYKNPPANRSTIWITKKYLQPGSIVLEGGCGVGDKVFALDQAGYQVVGVDFAEDTVNLILKHWPHLNIKVADVRNLPFRDECIDGYWSLGVIEHFYNGYDEIAREMHRVLKPGGILFLTFPMMNRIRMSRVRKKEIPPISHCACEELIDMFYQFALSPSVVIRHFQELGFKLRKQGGLSSLDCLAEETTWFSKIDQLINQLPFGLRTKIGVIGDMIWGKYFGHVALVVFEKRK